MQHITPTGPPPRLPNSDPAKLPTPPKTKAAIFLASIKKDQCAYPALTKDNLYDNWRREFRAVGRSHGMANLFDPDYIPHDPEDAELHTAQNEFMYAILCSKLKTDKGKDLLNEYKEDADAQTLLADLDDYHTKSTKAGLDSAQLLSYITLATLGPGSAWNGTTENFIIH